MKQPVRLVIGMLLCDGRARTPEEVCAALLPDYPGERQISPGDMEAHLQTLRAVGIVAAEACGDGVAYRITEYGQKRVAAFIPEASGSV